MRRRPDIGMDLGQPHVLEAEIAQAELQRVVVERGRDVDAEEAGVLDQAGGGVKSVSNLKLENIDKVYEACQSLLVSVGTAAEAKRNSQVEQSERKVMRSRT